MTRIFTFFLFLLAGSLSGQVAFKNVNVIPLTAHNLILENQTILIKKDKIFRIGASSEIEIPQDYEVIDGKNKFVIPGMMDAHAHLPVTQGIDIEMEDYLWLQIANGVTSIRSSRYEIGMLEMRDSLEKAGATFPRLFLSSPMINPWGKMYNFDYTKADSLIPEYIKMGYDHMKYLGGLNPHTHKSVSRICKEHNFPMFGHLPRNVGLEYCLSSGQKGIEHFQCYVDQDSASLVKYMELTEESGVINCPTLFWYLSNTPFYSYDLLKNLRGMEYIQDSVKIKWKSDYDKNAKDGIKDPKDNIRSQVLTSFAGSEAKMLISHGDGNYCVPGFGMLEEMKLFAKAGYDNYRILESACKNGALFYNQLEEWGTVEIGKRADLVLLATNPLEDIENMSSIAGVMLKGEWLDKKRLEEELRKIKE